jgi:hypothetical protein
MKKRLTRERKRGGRVITSLLRTRKAKLFALSPLPEKVILKWQPISSVERLWKE